MAALGTLEDVHEGKGWNQGWRGCPPQTMPSLAFQGGASSRSCAKETHRIFTDMRNRTRGYMDDDSWPPRPPRRRWRKPAAAPGPGRRTKRPFGCSPARTTAASVGAGTVPIVLHHSTPVT